MLKLKLQHFGQLMQRANSLEKTLMLGKIEGRRRRRWQRTKGLNSITDSVGKNLNKLWEIVKDRGAWPAAAHGVTKSWTQLSDWTTKQHISFQSTWELLPALWTQQSEFSWASVPVWRTCLHTFSTTPPVFFISPPVENHLIIKMES